MILFSRFAGKTREELESMELTWEDFTYTEINLLIFETVFSSGDKAFADKRFLHQATFEKIADDFDILSTEGTDIQSVSERNLKNRRKNSITPRIRETIYRIVPSWTDENEKNYIEFAKIQLEYYKIKKEMKIC